MHNFRSPDQPQVIALDPGKAADSQRDMTRLLTDLRETLPKAFRQEAFENEQRELGEKYQQQVRQIQEEFNRVLQEKGFGAQSDPTGNVIFVPLREGRPMTAEELERLSAADREALERRQSDVLHEFRSVMLRQRQIMQQLAEDIRAIERNFSATLIAP